ncbi:MAG: spore coat protein [Desulfobacterales bacterium SG8_35_2]|jgi:perosamine synthetase|nr:MAG: spore coat protein [Desulfobacterales bacterium SG8_35_2]
MIRLIKPYISFAEVEEDFRETFASGIFTKGEHVAALRKEIARYTGAQYGFLTTSATTALTSALKILDIKPGDEVIVSDFSFPATANVVEDIGALPVFADVSLDTYNLLPEELEKKITPKTKSIIFVDAFGNPSGLHAVKEICRNYKIPLIEDAACALGSSEHNEKCGNVADLTCFSFHPRKLLTTGEGGAITVNDANLAERLEIKLNHGATVATDGTQDFIDYGYNFRMSELQAIMARKQLVKIENIITHRNEIKESYRKYLEPLGFQAQEIGPGVSHNCQSIVFKVPDGLDRDKLIRYLRHQGIESTIGTYCLSAGTYYARKYNMIQPNSYFLEKNTITLPCYQDIETQYVNAAIKNFTDTV